MRSSRAAGISRSRRTDAGFGVTVPVATNGGTPITGPATEEFDINSINSAGHETLSYPAASTDKPQASLQRAGEFGDKPIVLDPSTWDYTDSSLTAIRLNPPGTTFGELQPLRAERPL